jgi:uncharacterized RDD family membrane protein YckC
VDHDFVILSPEKTILTYRLAGVGSRILAHILDLLAATALTIGAAMLAGYIGTFAPALALAATLMLSFLAPFLYFILQEGLWNGQTLGKKASGLRVRMEDGTPITFAAAVGRNLLRPADFLPAMYFVGMAAMFTNPKSQRLGDLACRTIVCHEGSPNRIYAMAPHTAGIHPFENQVGELRGMTAEEYDALRRLCDRFPELVEDRQQKLFEEIWTPFARRRRVPSIPNVHPLYLAEAVVMKYGRRNGLL